MTEFVIAECPPGLHIRAFAEKMALMARTTGQLVLGEFNQHTLEAKPETSVEEIVDQWSEAHARTSVW